MADDNKKAGIKAVPRTGQRQVVDSTIRRAAIAAGLFFASSNPAQANPAFANQAFANQVHSNPVHTNRPNVFVGHEVSGWQHQSAANAVTTTGSQFSGSITPYASHSTSHAAVSNFVQNSHAVKANFAVEQNGSGRFISLGSGASLDLTSSQANITLGDKLFTDGHTVTIVVGGTSKTLYTGSVVTAAEYVAVKEALAGGQTLTLDGQGRATGGTVDLNLLTTGGNVLRANNLVIAGGVTAVDNVAKGSTFTLTGNLVNYGSLEIISSAGGHQTGRINAKEITNEGGALISSNISLNGNNATATDLTLHARQDFTNYGAVESSGSLTINTGAGGTLTNAAGGSAVANGDINLGLGSGNLVNAGAIQSRSGNINITTPTSMDVNIAATGGTFCAAGDINVRDGGYTGANNINLAGGNYFSQNLNLYSGSGDIEGMVGQVSGNLNSHAGIEHMVASTANLQLGNNTISGDPIFANNAGNITIAGNNSFGEAVAIVASGNITATTTDAEITANGSQVLMVAGAFVTSINGGSATTNITGSPGSGITSVTISGASGSGGFIDLSANTTGTVIDTHSVVSGGNGGAVTLAAFANGANTGYVRLNNVGATNTINTSGDRGAPDASGGNGGSVTIIAGGTDGSGNAVSGGVGIATGAIFTSGGSGGQGINTSTLAGKVTVTTAQPVTDSASTPGQATIVFPGVLDSASGSTVTASTTLTANAGLALGNIITAGGGGSSSTLNNGYFGGTGGDVTIQASGNIKAGAIEAYGGGGGAAQNFSGGNAGNGGVINVSSTTGNINILGDLNTSGGGGGASYQAPGGSSGNSGNITVAAAGSLTIAGPVLAAGGGRGAGFVGGGQGGSGGGSLGGGGGASFGSSPAAGGGGFFGGASTNSAFTGGGGGGAFGGGQIDLDGNNGVQGQGGSFKGFIGGNFGQAGGSGNQFGTSAFNGSGHGLNANVVLGGSTINITGTVKSQFAGTGFTSSPFKDDSIVAGNIIYISSTVSISGNQNASGTVSMYTNGAGTLTSTSPSGFNAGGNLIFTGSSLAIISAGGIVAGNIDLSNPSGNGGSLTLIADANFLPFMDNPTPNKATSFGSFAPSGNTGDINVGDVSTFSTTGGTGGNVTAVAYSGASFFNSIDTHSTTAAAGSVQIISQGVNVANAVTTSGLTPGNITMTSATPVAIGSTTVTDGILLYGGFTAGSLQTGGINLGNLTTGGGSVNLTTATGAGFANVLIASINTAGAGGVSVPGASGTSGSAGGDIIINAGGNITITNNLEAFGGGGGGGYGGYSGVGGAAGKQGGDGGKGGTISLITPGGTISVGGEINTSGGGGGGGGGGEAGGAAGVGGNGGKGGAITLNASSSTTVSAIIYAADGGNGGLGGLGAGGLTDGGGGGGGGGSYGGGGGAGGGGFGTSSNGSGGGGGAGIFGGGGGGSGNPSAAANGGGGGGGFASGGIGGAGETGKNGFDGAAGKGGNSGDGSPNGGTGLGLPGGGGSASGSGGFIGSAATTASGTITITGGGSGLSISNIIFGGQVTLATQQGSDAGISFLAPIFGASSVTMSSDGFGTISSTNDSIITTPSLILSSDAGGTTGAGTGDIGSLLHPIQSSNGISALKLAANTAGNVWVNNKGSVAVDNSTVGQAYNLTTKADLNGNAAIAFNAGQSITANSVNLTTNSSNAGSGSGAITDTGSLSIATDKLVLTVNGTNPTAGKEDINLSIDTRVSNSVILTATTSGNVAISDNAAATTLLTSSAAKFSLTMTNGGDILLGTIPLISTITGTTSISLTVNGGGSILEDNAASQLNTPVLNLGVEFGSAGSLAQPILLTSAGATTINSTGPDAVTGSVFIKDDTSTVNVGNNTVGVFNLQATDANALVNVATGASGLISNNITISATGANGTINIQSVVNTLKAETDANGNGGTIAVTAKSFTGSTPAFPVTFNADGSSDGDGGSVTVNSSGNGTTTLGGTAAGNVFISAVSGTTGGNGGSATVITAGTINIVDDGAGNIGGVINVAPAAGFNGNGGNISLTANDITWASKSTNSLNLIADADGSGSGGSVAIKTGTAAVIGTGKGDFNFSATGTNGGSVTFNTTGTLGLVTDGSGVPGGINIIPTALSKGNGGVIDLTGSTISWGNNIGGTGNGTVLKLTADGDGSGGTQGLGGFIGFNQTSNALLTVGANNGQISLSAQGGNNPASDFHDGQGSGVSVATGGALIVNPGSINVAANATFSAGENISLQSNSATVFNYGQTTSANKNGVLGTLSVAANSAAPAGNNGNLTLINLGGGITNTAVITNVGSLTMQAGGTGSVVVGKAITTDHNVTLTAAGAVTGTPVITINGTAANDILTVSAGTGNIGGLTVIAANVQANSTSGAVTIVDKNPAGSTVNLLDSSSGQTKAFTFTDSLGNINVIGNITGGTALVIKAAATTSNNGNITIAGDLSAKGTNGAVTLTAGGTTTKGGVGGNITANSGIITAVKSVSLTAAKGSITVNAIGASKFQIPATVTLTALNNITNTSIVRATTTITEKATSTTASSINVGSTIRATDAKGVVTLTVAGPDVGGTPALNVTTGDISGGKSVTLTAAKGSVQVDTIGNAVDTGTVTISALNNITATGNILATSSVAKAATAVTIKTTSTGTASSINLNGNVQATSTATPAIGTVTITATGSGALALNAPGDISGGKSVTLAAAKSSINVHSTGQQSNPTGIVKITALKTITSDGNLKGTGVTLSQTLKTNAGGTGITINSLTATNGAISVIAAGAQLKVDDSVSPASITTAASTKTIAATITLENSNITTGASGSIVIGSGSGGTGVNIKSNAAAGGKGNVYVVMGAPPAKGVNTTNPGFATVTTPLTVFFGTNSITPGSNPSSTTLTGTNANLIFSTGKLPASAITVNAGNSSTTQITADPPLAVPSLRPASAFTNAVPTAISASVISAPAIANDVNLTVPATGSLNQTLSAAQTTNISLANASLTNSNSLYGGVSQVTLQGQDSGDNSYIVSEHGPRRQSDAAICSDVELGLSTEGIESLHHDGRIVLDRGNVLFAPGRDTVVETPQGKVTISAKSVVLVAASHEKLAVYNMADQHKDSVTIDVQGQKLTLAPGMHMTVAAEDAGAFAQVNAFEAISHRNLTDRVLKPGTKVYTTEFSALSAIGTVKPLQVLAKSQHHEAKKVAERMLKTTAILLTLRGSRVANGGAYQHYFRPTLTAMAK